MTMHQLYCLCSSQCFNSISYWNCSDIRNRNTLFLAGISVHRPSRITAFSRQVFEKTLFRAYTLSVNTWWNCHSKIVTCRVEWFFLAYSATKPTCWRKLGVVTKRIQTSVFTTQSSMINGWCTGWRNVIFTYLSRPCPSLLGGTEVCLHPKVDEKMSNGMW